jgi:hypothetical protein
VVGCWAGGGVDTLNVGAAVGGGIILEFEAGLEATGKKLVCENSASKGVIEKDLGPSSSTTLRGIGRDVGKYLVKMSELAGAVFKKFPEPVL